MTSRSEYRLVLRQDNADLRLTDIGYNVGLIGEERYNKFKQKRDAIDKEVERIKGTVIAPSAEVNAFLLKQNSSKISTGIRLSELLRRPELTYESLAEIDTGRGVLPRGVRTTAEIQIKYEGYIKRELSEIERQKKLEDKRLSEDIDYEKIRGLRLEAVEKLSKIRPVSIGQASRISGVSPADIGVLLIYLNA